MIARPVVLLPQPDSPTRPSVSPRRTSRLMPDTALTTRPVRPTGNSTTRSSTRSSDVVVVAQVGLAGAGHQETSWARDRRAARGASSARRAWYSGEPTGYQQANRWPGSSVAIERRLLGVAAVAGVRAAGRELAARRRVDEVRRPPGDRRQPRVRRVLELGDARHQRLGVGHPHVGEQRLRRRLLDDPPAVHHGDLVGVPGHDAEVVGDEDHRHVALPALLADEVEDLRLHGHVERRRRLVGEQQRRPAGQGDGDHHALAHAAGQLVRVLVEAALRPRGCARRAAAARPSPWPSSSSCPRWTRSGSAICSPIFISGFSESSGPGRSSPSPGPRRDASRSPTVDELLALEPHRAAADEVLAGEQAHDRARQHRLAGARLADDAERACPRSSVKLTPSTARTTPAASEVGE